nr:conserved hypothetical protein [Melanopsichium pennsylvanicum 4]
MTRSNTPPLSNSSTSSPADSPLNPIPTYQLPDYLVATRNEAAPSDQVENIAATLQNASIKLCDGPGLTPDERKEVDKALNDGIKVGLTSAAKAICHLDDLKHHLKLLDLFDRLRQAVQDGTEYFDYPSCHQDAGHIDEPGIDAPPPPYAPTAEPLPDANSKSAHKPTQQEADEAAAELSHQLLRQRRWSIFLNRAAYRLELWCTAILSSDTLAKHFKQVIKKDADQDKKAGFDLPDFALPPVDVALMLHSYHLNPCFKEEECQRLRTRFGLSFFNFPLHQLAQRVHPDLPILIDVGVSKVFWHERITSKRSKQPWDLNLQPPPGHPTNAQEIHGGTIFGLRVNCPRCQAAQYIPWTGVGKAPHQVGIGETGWERKCTETLRCQQLVSADNLQMRRFLDDYAEWRKSPGRPHDKKAVYFMAGTMIGAINSKRSSRDYFGEGLLLPVFKQEKPIEASAYKDHRISKSAQLEEVNDIAVQCDYSLTKFREWFEQRWMSSAITPKHKLPEEKAQQMSRIAVLMRPYQNGNAAAYGEGLCNVVDSVKRQTSFNLEIEKLGWSKRLDLLEQGALDDVLSRSLIRYHKFLDLMASTHALLTPTLDIDLCWHTHQLQAHYYEDCFKLTGRFINHDDAIETGILKDAFERTAQLWKQRFHQPYSQCGCLYNNPNALKKLQTLLGSSSSAEPLKETAESSKGSSFTSRIKGKWRAAKQLPGDREEDAPVWQDATHPSAHQAVIVKEEEHRHDKLREQMVKEWAQGKRREGHESAFV